LVNYVSTLENGSVRAKAKEEERKEGRKKGERKGDMMGWRDRWPSQTVFEKSI